MLSSCSEGVLRRQADGLAFGAGITMDALSRVMVKDSLLICLDMHNTSV